MPVFICQGCGEEHTSWEGSCPKCGVSETIRLSPQTDRMVGRVVKGKWKIVRRLGQGGMGAVYLAEQVSIGQRVALKFLKSEFSADKEIAKRFLREAKSYALVAHPNAVAFYDFGQDDDGNLFIAMEYCEGVDLKKVLAEQRRLGVADAVDMVLQVADVLVVAHSHGIIHRDLKPENIMIRKGLRGLHAKVLDFGIARLIDAGTQLTIEGAIAGTPRYMSPEQVEGRGVDHRADIYALGIVLFEALTGHQPFDGMTIAEILRKQVAEPMPHLVDRAPDLDAPQIDAVIQKACAKRRDDRWPDLLTFASALNAAQPTQAHLTSPLRLSVLATGAAGPTPVPEGPTGVAVPGTELDAGGGAAATMMKATPAPVQRPVATGGFTASAAPTALDHTAAVPAPERVPAPDRVAVPTPDDVALVRPSRAPLLLAVVVALGLGGAGVYWFGLREPTASGESPAGTSSTTRTGTGTGTGTVTGGGTVTTPPVQPEVGGGSGVATGDSSQQVVGEAVKMMNASLALTLLSQGKTEFEVAKLDSAESYLSQVARDTPSFGEAQELLGKISKIRDALKAADQQRATGHCAEALPLYRRVLALNPRIAAAQVGERACRDSAVPTVMQ